MNLVSFRIQGNRIKNIRVNIINSGHVKLMNFLKDRHVGPEP